MSEQAQKQIAPCVYIAGPMTGLPDNNYPAFNEMAAMLRGCGFEVRNPAENRLPEGSTWADFMRAGIEQLLTCDTVVLLAGWSKSKGAKLECQIAEGLGLQIVSHESADFYKWRATGPRQ